jgi:hypothetical protein
MKEDKILLNKKIPDEFYIKVFNRAKEIGNQSQSAYEFGISPQAFSGWLKRNPKYKNQL